MTKQHQNLTIVIFPYLFVQDGLKIDGLDIKPSFQKTVGKERKQVKNQLLQIAQFFRAGRNQQISHWSYLVTKIGTKKQ